MFYHTRLSLNDSSTRKLSLRCVNKTMQDKDSMSTCRKYLTSAQIRQVLTQYLSACRIQVSHSRYLPPLHSCLKSFRQVLTQYRYFLSTYTFRYFLSTYSVLRMYQKVSRMNSLVLATTSVCSHRTLRCTLRVAEPTRI